MERTSSCNPWDISGPSMIGAAFYAEGFKPKPQKAEKPKRVAKPRAEKAEKPIPPVDEMREYLRKHSIWQTAEKFGCTCYAVKLYTSPIRPLKDALDVDAVRAFIAAGGSFKQAAAKFHRDQRTIRRRIGNLSTIRAPIPWRKLPTKPEKFTIYLPAEMKAWVMSSGGQDLVRGLIAKAMEAQ